MSRPRFIGPYQMPGEAYPTILEVQRKVCREYGLTLADLVGEDRRRAVSKPRQTAMYLAVKMCGTSQSMVGRQFRRDHSTVMHAVAQVRAWRARDDAYDRRVRALEGRL